MMLFRVLAIMMLLSLAIAPTSAQEDDAPFLPGDLQVITAENAGRVREIGRLGYGSISDIAFSPNGEYFAVSAGIGVLLYRAGDYSAEPRLFEGGTGRISFSPDSSMLAARYHLWEVETGKLFHHFEGYSPVFIPDGSRLIAANGQEIIVLDVASGEYLTRQSVGEEVIRRIALNQDGVTLAIDVPGNIILWSLEIGAQTVELQIPPEPYPSIFSGETAFSPDGTTLVHVGFDGYAVWDVETGQVIHQQDSWFNPVLSAVDFSSDGSLMAIGDGNARVTIYDIEAETYWNSFSHEDEIRSVAFSTDGSQIAAAAINGIVHIWDMETGAKSASLTGFSSMASVLGFSSSDTVFSAVSLGGAAWQWDLSTGAQINAAQGYKFHVSHGTVPVPSAIELNRSGNLLATGSLIDGRIRLWTPSGQSRGILEIGGGQDVLDVAFTRDSTIIAALGYGNVFMWELETGARITGLRVHDCRAVSIEFNPDGSLLAVGDQAGRVTLQDRITARVIAEFQGAEGDARNLTFSPDGTIIAFTNYCWRCPPDNYEYAIRLWNTTTGELLHYFEGHTHVIEGLAFSRDGALLVSVARDGTLRFWDVVTGQELAVTQASSYALAVNQTGTIIATNNTDGTIRLWGVRP